MKLSELKQGQTAGIVQVGGSGALRQHFLDMGLIPGTEIEFVKEAPMGDPVEYRIWGYELTLRLAEAQQIEVRLLEEKESEQPEQKSREEEKKISRHPGLGETGIFHKKDEEQPVDKNRLLTFGLAGNQNCGKTTLFNQLTGSNQHVGNFPGVTVDRKDGPIRKQENTRVTDLPGIYSMSPYTSEEIVRDRKSVV